MEDVFASFVKAFVLLFAIMDPFSSVPILVALTKGFKERDRNRAVDEAIFVALVIVLVFAFFGTGLLDVLTIKLDDFMVAGGIVIGLLGIQLMFVGEDRMKKAANYQLAAVVIATPMLTGPGVISTVIVLHASEGLVVTLAAAAVSLGLAWIILRNSARLFKAMGHQFLGVFSRIMGLLLIALAVGFVRRGLGM
ncbi:MAG: MarC family protein [Candidatus Micrarchaeota archaeon]